MTHPAAAEARLWIGTPYRDQHSTRGAGCDCLGLLRGVYRSVVGAEPETPPPYGPSWGEVGDREPMLEAADRHLIRVQRPIAPGDLSSGDVLVFRMRRGRVAKHCAIVTGVGLMTHACASSDRVAEHIITPYWFTKIAGVYQWPTS